MPMIRHRSFMLGSNHSHPLANCFRLPKDDLRKCIWRGVGDVTTESLGFLVLAQRVKVCQFSNN